MQSDIMLNAVFEELLKADRVEAACPRFCPALAAHCERAADHMCAAQREAENHHNERPEL